MDSSIKGSANTLPQGSGSRLDADTLRTKRPDDFIQLIPGTVVNKFMSTAVTVNPGAIASGASSNVSVSWGRTFLATPVGWLGDITGSNYANLILTLSSVSTTGATITVYNPTAGSITPNFTINVMALGRI